MKELRKERHVKTIEELTFTDDGMFQAVLHEPDVCAELIERLLHIKVGKIEYPELEKQIAPYYTTKGVRLDVYLKDVDKIIDIEIQNYPERDIGNRTRYYQSMIDMDSLMKNEDYSELKESYILFICKHDPFKDEDEKPYGLPCYIFKSICVQKSEVNLHDNSLKVIYNASAYEKEKDEKIKNFLRFIHTNKPGNDDFSNRLSELVEKTKENEKFRSTFLAMNLHDRDLIWNTRKEALAEGSQQKAVETAENFLKMNILSPEQIAQGTGLAVDKVLEIKEKMTVKSE